MTFMVKKAETANRTNSLRRSVVFSDSAGLRRPVTEFADRFDDLMGGDFNGIVDHLEPIRGKITGRIENARGFFQGFINDPGTGRTPHVADHQLERQNIVCRGGRSQGSGPSARHGHAMCLG